MQSAQVTSAPSPMTLLDEDGTEHEYQVTPLTDRDFDSLDSWIQSRVISVTRASLKNNPDVTPLEYQLEMKLAMKASIGVSLYEDNGSDTINTPLGVARLAWQMTRKEHSELGSDHFSRYSRQGENYNEILRLFRLQNTKHLEDIEVEDKGKGEDGESKN